MGRRTSRCAETLRHGGCSVSCKIVRTKSQQSRAKTKEKAFVLALASYSPASQFLSWFLIFGSTSALTTAWGDLRLTAVIYYYPTANLLTVAARYLPTLVLNDCPY